MNTYNDSEKWYNKKMFTIIMLIVFFPVGIYFMWKNEHFKKWVRMSISIYFGFISLFYIFAISGDYDSNDSSENTKSISSNIETEVTGSLDVTISDEKINVEIDTNAIDGSIFEFFIVDSNFEMKSNFIEVKDGIAKSIIDVNKEWETGYLATGASMRFNLDDHPQPENVREAYGEKGEKLKGDLIEENNLGGYNISIKSDPIAYPNIETVQKVAKDSLDKAISEVINLSDGVLLEIKPFESEDWRMVKVVVSDTWYYSADHEKERFAEQVGSSVSQMVISSGILPKDKSVSVYFYDMYNKELASPKVFGGYKIKR